MRRPTRTATLTAAAGLLSLLLAACGTESADDPVSSPTATAAATTSPEDTSPDETSPEEPTVTDESPATPIPVPSPEEPLPTGPVDPTVLDRDDVQEAIAAEAERRGVAEDEVTVAGFAEVTWSDGSLGCPEPGMMYTQALVPGYQLILEVDGDLASYHAGTDTPFSYCASPMPPAPTSMGGSSDY